MQFDLSHDQKLLVDTVASFVRKESPVSRFRKLRQDPLGYSPEVWRKMGDLGWIGMVFPESVGGYGGGFVDASLLLEQLGSALVPEPYLASVVLGGMALLRSGSAEQQARYLPALLAGESTMALAYAERQSRFQAASVLTTAEKAASGYRLRGQKIFVLNGHAADQIIVSARTSGEGSDPRGVSLFVVERGAPGLTVRSERLMDGQRAAVLTFERVELGPGQLLGAEGQALPALEWLLDLGAAAACAEAVGIMRTVLSMTCEYLTTREQFGAKIGSFQALQHRAVDMFIETELAKSASLLASLKVDEPDEVERKTAVSAAKAQVAQSGRFVTQQAVQLHGGIGVTDEHDIGLYFKRMHVLGTLFGDEEYHTARFASLPSFTRGLGAAAGG